MILCFFLPVFTPRLPPPHVTLDAYNNKKFLIQINLITSKTQKQKHQDRHVCQIYKLTIN